MKKSSFGKSYSSLLNDNILSENTSNQIDNISLLTSSMDLSSSPSEMSSTSTSNLKDSLDLIFNQQKDHELMSYIKSKKRELYNTNYTKVNGKSKKKNNTEICNYKSTEESLMDDLSIQGNKLKIQKYFNVNNTNNNVPTSDISYNTHNGNDFKHGYNNINNKKESNNNKSLNIVSTISSSSRKPKSYQSNHHINNKSTKNDKNIPIINKKTKVHKKDISVYENINTDEPFNVIIKNKVNFSSDKSNSNKKTVNKNPSKPKINKNTKSQVNNTTKVLKKSVSLSSSKSLQSTTTNVMNKSLSTSNINHEKSFKKPSNDRKEMKLKKYDLYNLLDFPSSSDYIKMLEDSYLSINIEDGDNLLNDKSSNSDLNIINPDLLVENKKDTNQSSNKKTKSNKSRNVNDENETNENETNETQLKLIIPSASLTFHEETDNTSVINSTINNYYNSYNNQQITNSYQFENILFNNDNPSFEKLIRIPSTEIVVDESLECNESEYISEEDDDSKIGINENENITNEQNINKNTSISKNEENHKKTPENNKIINRYGISNINNNTNMLDNNNVKVYEQRPSKPTIINFSFSNYIKNSNGKDNSSSVSDVKIINYLKKSNTSTLKLH